MFSDHLDGPTIRRNSQYPPAPSLSTEPLTPEYASRQQQPLGGLQTDLPTGGATSGEPSTVENLPISYK
ncbi:hypothetical protein B7463_g6917, partial [Scytalidium lignicola]